MVGVRGFVWGQYVDDIGVSWALRVDADHALSPQRGWLGGVANGLQPLPRGWLPRRVIGVDPSGRQQSAVVARPDADLWTGMVTEFDIVASDTSLQTCQVVKYLGERSTEPPP